MKKLHIELVYPASEKRVDISDEVFSGLTVEEIREYSENIFLPSKGDIYDKLNKKTSVAVDSIEGTYTEITISFSEYRRWYQHYSPQLFAGWVTAYDAWLYDHNRINKKDFYLLFPTLSASAIGNNNFVFREFEDKESIDYRIMESFSKYFYNLSDAFLRFIWEEE